jgi:hypothetical protein
LEPGGVELRGSVRSAIGEPIASASVAVVGRARSLAVTDAAGAFSMWVAEGDVDVVAWASGYADVVVRGRASEPLALVLPREAILSGKVVDAESGKPIAMARVRAGTKERRGIDPLVYTDASGEFRIPALPAGTYGPSAHTDQGHGELAELPLFEGTMSNPLVIEVRRNE